jgi:hypothetical protein
VRHVDQPSVALAAGWGEAMPRRPNSLVLLPRYRDMLPPRIEAVSEAGH